MFLEKKGQRKEPIPVIFEVGKVKVGKMKPAVSAILGCDIWDQMRHLGGKRTCPL